MWGIEPGYHDVRGVWHETAPATAEALLASMGAHDGPEGPAPPAAWVVEAGDAVSVAGDWLLMLEDGTSLEGHATLPPDVPLGYHRLRWDAGAVGLIVAPERCPSPPADRTWGWAVQLYSVRSAESWGIGDLGDLRRLARWSRAQGAGMVLLSPLHAALPVPPQQPSPYSPSSRCFRNPIYLAVDGVDAPGEVAALNGLRRIDRDRVWSLKLAALERSWFAFGADADFDQYCDEEGPALAAYAAFCAIAEEHGGPWTEWPTELRDVDGPGVLAFVSAHLDRVRFHQWLQWKLDRQLLAAGEEIALVQDLAVGVDPYGADTWIWSDCFARHARVGAPPDEFNALGQDWNLPPVDPWRLREAGYESFIRTLRAGFRHAGGLRVDHVMGLFRLYWIPLGATPADGAYVRYPWQDMLRILALESHRAGAYVVGEDLGTVEPVVRERLRAAGVLTYRLLWFEPERPAEFPVDALGAVTTHDLPTIAGLWTGADIDEVTRLGLRPNLESFAATRDKLRDWTGCDDAAPVDVVVARTHDLLAEAPCRLVTATLDDALGIEERPNVPGTTDERPNWSIALPKTLEEIEGDPLVACIGHALNRDDRG